MLFNRQAPGTGEMTAAEAVAGARDGRVTLVDVREFAEVAMTGKARGALHVPLSRLQDICDPRHPDHNAALKADATLALYCASGGRSGRAAQVLEQMGYADVHNIGGFGHWVQAGGEVERP